MMLSQQPRSCLQHYLPYCCVSSLATGQAVHQDPSTRTALAMVWREAQCRDCGEGLSQAAREFLGPHVPLLSTD